MSTLGCIDTETWKEYFGKSNDVCYSFVLEKHAVGAHKENKYKCRICKFVGSYTNGSSNFKRHLNTKHDVSFTNRVPFDTWTCRTNGIVQSKLPTLNMKKYNSTDKYQRKLIRKCAIWVTMNKRCFTVVEDQGFIDLLAFLWIIELVLLHVDKFQTS